MLLRGGDEIFLPLLLSFLDTGVTGGAEEELTPLFQINLKITSGRPTKCPGTLSNIMLVVSFRYKEHNRQHFERMGKNSLSCARGPKQEQHFQGPIKCVRQIVSSYDFFPPKMYCKENMNTYTACLCLLWITFPKKRHSLLAKLYQVVIFQT